MTRSLIEMLAERFQTINQPRVRTEDICRHDKMIIKWFSQSSWKTINNNQHKEVEVSWWSFQIYGFYSSALNTLLWDVSDCFRMQSWIVPKRRWCLTSLLQSCRQQQTSLRWAWPHATWFIEFQMTAAICNWILFYASEKWKINKFSYCSSMQSFPSNWCAINLLRLL